MASNNIVRQGTYGRTIEIDTKIDLTPYAAGPAVVDLQVKRPDKTETTWSATFKDADPTTQILVHVLATGDVDIAGDYLILSHVKNDSASPPVDDLGTNPFTLQVLSKFKKV